MSKIKYSIVISAGLLLALILRVWALISLSDSIYYDQMLFDERVYHDWAVQIMNGTWNSKTVYEFAPLPAYFTALLYTVFSPNILYVRIANIIFGILTCLFTSLSGTAIGGKRTGICSLILAAVYSPFIFYSIVPLKTSMSLFLFSLFLWLFLKSLDKNARWYNFLFTGTVMGLMSNVRPNYLVIILPLFGFILFFHHRDKVVLKKAIVNVALLGCGIAFATLPFIARNYFMAGDAVLTVSQSGFNLYLGNNLDNLVPYYRPVPFASSSPFKQSIHFNIEASRRTGEKLSSQDASAFWMHEVVEIAKQQPVAFAKKILLKALVFCNRFEAGDHYHIGFIANFVPFFGIPLLNFSIVFPLGMAGMIFGLRRNRKVAACASVFVLYGLTLVIYFCNTRYRLPMLVILIPLAALCCDKLYQNLKLDFNRPPVSILFFILFFSIVEFLPIIGTGDMSAYYNTHALLLHSQRKEDEAIGYWRQSSEMETPYSAFANLALAKISLDRGGYREATSYLRKIADDSFAASNKFELFGDISLKNGLERDAESYYRRALTINSGKVIVRTKLIRLLKKTDRKGAAEEEAKLKYIISFY